MNNTSVTRNKAIYTYIYIYWDNSPYSPFPLVCHAQPEFIKFLSRAEAQRFRMVRRANFATALFKALEHQMVVQ